jgi:hypothetical protein
MRKNRTLLLTGVLLVGFLAITYLMLSQQPVKRVKSEPTPETAMTHSTKQEPKAVLKVPKYYETAPTNLPSTLPAGKFIGKAREAYQAAKEIPATLAQLPCYCHCDMSLGHKSLHSCFEDEHAASCATCIGEALTAFYLQKDQGLSETDTSTN